MTRTILISATCAVLASSAVGVSHPALDFYISRAPSATSPVPAKATGDKAAIKRANQVAASRHGVPIEFMDRLTMRESGFRFVKGPQTRWGRAHGPHQILCSTAAYLGEPDCNRLMYDAERSADLSARYIREGYNATGSWHGAAAYYHGGPDKRLHGRKTAAYAAAVGGRDYPRTVNAYAPPQGIFGASILPAAFVPASYVVKP